MAKTLSKKNVLSVAFEEMRGSRKYFQIIGMIQNGTELPRNAAQSRTATLPTS